MSEKLNIIVAGEWTESIYEKAMANAFAKLGHSVIPFQIADYFGQVIGNAKPIVKLTLLQKYWYKVQYKFIVGPSLYKLNNALLQLVKEVKPDLIFFYRGNYIFPSTLYKIKKGANAKLFLYNNDDPFSISHPAYMWRYMMKGIQLYDHVFAYREKNIIDYQTKGISNVSLLRSYYRKDENFPLVDLKENKYTNPVCFIGHYEDDGRDVFLKYLFENNVPLKIYGTLWDRSKFYDFFSKKMNGPITSVYADYNLCINSNEICLVFLSKKNSDTYTRRCFEIPAANTFMLAEYTNDLNELFTEGLEAEYFRNKEELLEKVNYFLKNKQKRALIATAGYKRLMADGHEVTDRAKQVIATYYTLIN